MFINNENNNNLKQYLLEKIPFCSEIKILVGFFYFSGINEIIDAISENENLKLKILVGLQADVFNESVIEYVQVYSNPSIAKENFIDSIKKVFNHPEFDKKTFYKHIDIFIQLLKNNRIEIRKCKSPNHAKLYVFKIKDDHAKLINGFFITGSSNLTRAGLDGQNELNVSIKDYGWKEANDYFDQHWENAIKLNEYDINKIITTIREKTLIKSITPFEAYVYVLKTFLDSFEKKELSDNLKEKLHHAGYYPYSYQLDAIGQALSILENHNGVIIADVVGLGKSVIASAIAFEMRQRGIVIAPPGLIGTDDKSSGWKKYLEDFGLTAMGWEAYSIGKLEEVFEITRKIKDIQVVIIDEAHRFRNESTQSYELLKEICRNKKVILLTATPFNNRPSDIFSLLKLFVIPKKSSITFDTDLEAKFAHYGYQYDELLYIKKNFNNKNQKNALRKFKKFFPHSNKINIQLVNAELKKLSLQIKSVLTPVMIRRNRLDLIKHPEYKKDIQNLSQVNDPIEGFYQLNAKQSEFYDRVISQYFIEDGKFSGAIYMPFKYSNKKSDQFDELFQTNLYNLMRRLLVKRFESSFGAFRNTIQNFLNIHQKVKSFIEKSNVYILDRSWINKIFEYDEEEFEEEFNKKMLELTGDSDEVKKSNIIYKKEDLKKDFFIHLDNDIALLQNILDEIKKLNLSEKDPKADAVIAELKKWMKNPSRKIIIFSEFQNTVQHFYDYTKKHHPKIHKKILPVIGNISKQKYLEILQNFDASYEEQKNDYHILLCTDKLSEGFNLNRAGFIINYDIPWNPVRVIQRIGRINRIGKKVFDKLYIKNFFPTQQGENEINQRKIAESKMFMIHHSIGEDAKVFSEDEQPTASELYTRINSNPEKLEEESIYTKVFVEFQNIKKQYPHIMKNINNLPPRIKVAKHADKNELFTIIKKQNLYFLHCDYDNHTINEVEFPAIWDRIKSAPNTAPDQLSENFWNAYTQLLAYTPSASPRPKSENSDFSKACNKLRSLLNIPEYSIHKDFIELLIYDLENYYTLSDFTLKKIINIKKTNDLINLKEQLGNAYIDNLKIISVEDKKQIIIAIENQTKNIFNTAKQH